ncbi:MAG: hypothetical protein JWP87_5886 [Labilithrix sp.]|nr:hypothetical protein [Labilithrix sp.]
MGLAEQTVVGLPRSNLVKKSEPPRPNVVAVPRPATTPLASVAPVATFAPKPPPMATSEFAPAGLPVPAWMEAPTAEPIAAPVTAPMALPVPAPVLAAVVPAVIAIPEVAVRESFRTKADSIEVDMVESQRAPQPDRDAPPPAPAFIANEPMRGAYASAPSASELLERAALGPARMTWESIVLPADPILDEKRTPHVAERRARLTRVVKYTLGACLGVCVVALGVSALSGGSSSTTESGSAASESVGKTVASKGIVPVEPFDGTKHAKAIRRVAPAATTAAIVRPKHR